MPAQLSPPPVNVNHAQPARRVSAPQNYVPPPSDSALNNTLNVMEDSVRRSSVGLNMTMGQLLPEDCV